MHKSVERERSKVGGVKKHRERELNKKVELKLRPLNMNLFFLIALTSFCFPRQVQ
jgi:hypothetical protein